LDKNTKISIVILTYNRCGLLDSLLTSIKEIKYASLECIVVDNHSIDTTKEMVAEKHQEIKFISTERNIGVGARNIGIERASGDIIICLDDDVFGINDQSIYKIIDKFKQYPTLGSLNFKIIDSDTGEQCNWVHHCERDKYSDKDIKTYEITEGAVAFKKDSLRKAGLYPNYFFISHEGPDLALRLIDNGYDVMYCGDIVVKHCHSNLGHKTWLNYYYDTRNQYWLAARNLPLVYAIKYLLRGQISTLVYSIRDGFFKYWIKAVVDGVMGLPRAFCDRKVVSRDTQNVIKAIDEMRPSIVYMIKERVFARGMRL